MPSQPRYYFGVQFDVSPLWEHKGRDTSEAASRLLHLVALELVCLLLPSVAPGPEGVAKGAR